MKHTPGPWVAIPIRQGWGHQHPSIFENGTWAILPEGDLERVPIAEVDHGNDHCPDTRIQAGYDARLIAAAPELLNALRWAMHGPFGVDDDAEAAEARALLARLKDL